MTSNASIITAIEQHDDVTLLTVDGVVDLATAFELISEIKHSTIAGQFTAPGGDDWGVLLSKGSKLTPCVSQAVNALQANGTLAALNKRWIASAANVPELH